MKAREAFLAVVVLNSGERATSFGLRFIKCNPQRKEVLPLYCCTGRNGVSVPCKIQNTTPVEVAFSDEINNGI